MEHDAPRWCDARAAKVQDEMEGAAVIKLLDEDEALLVGRNALLVLDLRFDIVDGVRGLDLKRDCLVG